MGKALGRGDAVLERRLILKLLHNIFQVAGPGLSHSFDATAYLLKGRKGWFLIDCGTPEGFGQIKENIKKAGVDPAQIQLILGTHGHYDHVGAAHLWKEESGCSLFLHERDIPQVEEGNSQMTSASLLYGTKSVPCKVDGKINEGDIWQGEGFTVQAVYTPGHTMGSVSFVVEAGGYHLLIAGDAIWGGYSKKIGSDESVWRESLHKLTSMHFDFYTFGHVNAQLIGDADRRLKEAQMAFANYYNPWFKTFFEEYRY